MTRHLTGIDGAQGGSHQTEGLQECVCGSAWWTIRGTAESQGRAGLCIDEDNNIVGYAGAFVCADCGRERAAAANLQVVE